MNEIFKINENIHGIKTEYKDIYTTVYTVKTPGGTLLFDAASFDADITQSVIPMLHSLGIDDLKYVFISHNHKDHAGGLEELLKHYPDIEVLSRCPRLKEKFSGYKVTALEDGNSILDDLELVTIPGHTIDSAGIYDKRTKTLISGDSMQLYGIFGSGLWASNINYPIEHFEALEKLSKMDIEKICTAHDYHPQGQFYTGKEEVLKAIDNCRKPLEKIMELIDENPKASDEEIAARYNSAGDLPTLGAHVVTAVRNAKGETK